MQSVRFEAHVRPPKAQSFSHPTATRERQDVDAPNFSPRAASSGVISSWRAFGSHAGRGIASYQPHIYRLAQGTVQHGVYVAHARGFEPRLELREVQGLCVRGIEPGEVLTVAVA
jgi:hypothetical protein